MYRTKAFPLPFKHVQQYLTVLRMQSQIHLCKSCSARHEAAWWRTMNSVFMGPTVISPVVTRLRWPPLMPLIIWLPTMVSAHTCPATALSTT